MKVEFHKINFYPRAYFANIVFKPISTRKTIEIVGLVVTTDQGRIDGTESQRIACGDIPFIDNPKSGTVGVQKVGRTNVPTVITGSQKRPHLMILGKR